jgi:hypothetical protein
MLSNLKTLRCPRPLLMSLAQYQVKLSFPKPKLYSRKLPITLRVCNKNSSRRKRK